MRARIPTKGPEGTEISRDEHGVLHVDAPTLESAYWGLGFAHATDRAAQMLLMRILGWGRASELLDGSDATVAIDKFFRRMGWSTHLEEEVEKLTPQARAVCQAYCDGANAALARSVPWELRLLRYRPEPWQITDAILLARMTGYLTLAQSQGEIERLLVEMVQAGVSREKLEELFPGALGGLDEALLRSVKLTERIVPAEITWLQGAPRMMASNNWVVSGVKSASGKPILANDPHLEINRLPAVWYEIAVTVRGRYALSATMPGLPGLLVTRTSDLAWGATYTFMDAIDSWVEHCRDGKYRRGDEWLPFTKRVEVIRRKGKSPVEVVFYENDHGVLDGDPHQEGYYLSTRWSGTRSGARSLSHAIPMFEATTVEEGMSHLGELESSFSWVLADRHGNIGFQMSGLAPRRRPGTSGLVPLPGWDAENDWRGFEKSEDLPRCLNPEQGFFVTANHDLNAYGRVQTINAAMGPYRHDRITQVLSERTTISSEEMGKLQMDVYSLQAEAFMKILRPVLPGGDNARILADWNLEYDLESRGATLFERFYTELRALVFGAKAGLGDAVAKHLSEETGIFTDFYDNFDRVLLSEQSAWFEGRSREELYGMAAERALATEARPWKEKQQLQMTNILFGGKLPAFLGFDRGPIPLPGGRATVHQGQIYRSGGRATSFAPSIRIVTDFAGDSWMSCLAGGPSDRRFSKWYASEIEAWSQGRFKTLRP